MKNRKWLMILCCVILVAAVVAAVVLLTRPKDTQKETEATAAPEATETTEKAGESRDVLKEIRDRGTVLIAMEGAWQPWTYHDEQGNLTGFDVEIGNLVAEGLGVKAEFKETAWDGILAGVDSGRFDMACNGVGYTEERAKAYSFSTPYVYTEMVLVVREDNTEIQALEDLKGKKTANSPNSTYATRAENAGAEVVYVDTLGETMEMLLQGRVDATLNAKESVDSYLAEHPEAKIKVVGSMAGEPVAIPMQKGENTKALVEEVNRILEAAREDGRLAALSEKYFGRDLTKEE